MKQTKNIDIYMQHSVFTTRYFIHRVSILTILHLDTLNIALSINWNGLPHFKSQIHIIVSFFIYPIES